MYCGSRICNRTSSKVMSNEEIIEAIIREYEYLHQVRNALRDERHELAGLMVHTCGQLQNILSYYEENK